MALLESQGAAIVNVSSLQPLFTGIRGPPTLWGMGWLRVQNSEELSLSTVMAERLLLPSSPVLVSCFQHLTGLVQHSNPTFSLVLPFYGVLSSYCKHCTVLVQHSSIMFSVVWPFLVDHRPSARGASETGEDTREWGSLEVGSLVMKWIPCNPQIGSLETLEVGPSESSKGVP